MNKNLGCQDSFCDSKMLTTHEFGLSGQRRNCGNVEHVVIRERSVRAVQKHWNRTIHSIHNTRKERKKQESRHLLKLTHPNQENQ
jgi:hypothetical protein